MGVIITFLISWLYVAIYYGTDGFKMHITDGRAPFRSMPVLFIGGGFLFAFIPAIMYGMVFGTESASTVPEKNISVASCVSRGVAYFKEIGSYPTLSSEPNAGRSAEVVARERCNRTTTAFGS